MATLDDSFTLVPDEWLPMVPIIKPKRAGSFDDLPALLKSMIFHRLENERKYNQDSDKAASEDANPLKIADDR